MAALRTQSVALLLLALAAREPYAQTPGGTEEAGLWRLRSAQAMVGVFGGTLVAVLGGVAGYLLMPPCFLDGLETADARAAASRSCSDYGVPAGLVLGAIAGTSLGIYGVGRNGGGEGAFLATAGGSAAGLVAGVALAVHARPRVGYAYALAAGFTTLSGLAAYHATDRVKILAAWESAERKPDAAAGPAQAMSLRPEVRVTLIRF